MRAAEVALLPILCLVVCGAVSAEEKGEPTTVGWRLAPSDFARYERRKVTVKGGKERFGRGSIASVHGHDLRQDGQYFPASPRRGDLPAIFAFRLPPSGETAGKVDFSITPQKVTTVHVKGRVESLEIGPDGARVAAEYTFGSRGRGDRTDSHQIYRGTARVSSLFDASESVIREARVEIAYYLRKIDAKPKDKVERVDAAYDFRRKYLRRARYAGFQKDVDDAIERGLAHLRTLRQENGTFKPHGDWVFGTTALAAFTLVSCGAARSEPEIEETLAWMCEQEPGRTYEQAVGLMAVDRAYAPAWEIARERRGEPVPLTRDLPPVRRAWCERTAAALEKAARSPGVWSYSGKSTQLVLQFDSSNTQYAVLGLRAAARLGIEAKERTWLGVIQYFGQVRERKGRRGSVRLVREEERFGKGATVADTPVASVAGFRYSTLDSYPKAWGSMTCAGIASLAIARDQLVRIRGGPLPPRREREIKDLTLSGWGWLDRHWGIDRHPEKPGNAWYYYYLYNLERAGVLTRVRLVGGKDWYFEGAVQLIARQNKNGSWNEPGGDDVTETCFALLFLKRATAPLTPSGK
jgi:hypothetical protein